MSEEMHRTLVRKTNGAHTIGVAGSGTGEATLVQTMPIWQLVGIRAGRMYLGAFIGILTATGLGQIDLETDTDTLLANVLKAMGVALFPAGWALVQNLFEFLTEIDVKRPGWRA